MIYGEASHAFCYSHPSLVAAPRLLSLRHHHLDCKNLLLSWVHFSAFFTQTLWPCFKTFDITPVGWHLMCLLQVPEGVPSGPVPSVLAAQVPAAQAFHLFQLALSGIPPTCLLALLTFAFSESETATPSEEEGPDVQLQRRHLLREVRRDNRIVSARR